MIEGALYPIPTLNGTLAGGVRTVIVSPEGEVFLTEPQKEYLKSLILMPGDPLTITYDLGYQDHYGNSAEIDNDATSIEQGDSYTATVTSVNKRYWLNVTVLMGGIDVTNTLTTRTSFNTVVISIPNVTGNIRITTSVATYIRSLNTAYDSASAFKNVYEDTDIDELKSYLSCYLIGYLDNEEPEEISLTDDEYVIEGDLTLPESAGNSGNVNLVAKWVYSAQVTRSFRVKVWRRTT